MNDNAITCDILLDEIRQLKKEQELWENGLTNDEKWRVFNEGVLACVKGDPNNPYIGIKADIWNDGWNEALGESYDNGNGSSGR